MVGYQDCLCLFVGVKSFLGGLRNLGACHILAVVVTLRLSRICGVELFSFSQTCQGVG